MTTIRVKLKSFFKIALNKEIYLKQSEGFKIVRKYRNILTMHVVIMEKKINNG